MTNFTSNNRKISAADETVACLVALAQKTLGDPSDASESASGDVRAGEQQAGLVRFERAIARRTLRRRSGALRWTAGLGLAAAALVFSFLTLRDHRQALTFSVVNGVVSDGGYIRANSSQGTALHFSDGSSVALDPGTGARVGDFDANGGRVLLESGRARVHVTPRPKASWTIDAGPYSVHVIGTEFDIRWLASEEVLDLHLVKGAIVVRGPLASEGLSMKTGAHLFANVRKGEIRLDGTSMSVTEGATPPPAREVAAAEPSTVDPAAAHAAHLLAMQTPTLRTHGSAMAGARTERDSGSRDSAERDPRGHDTSWSTRLARGDYHGILADAQRRGLDTVVTTASAVDLNVLADAARFARRADVARSALLAERERFPGSAQGREAAFFLGSLTEDESGQAAMKSALAWYDCYLRESPNGAFVRPVLGRKMMLVYKLTGAPTARPLAIEYLERFSDGPYAGSARKLLATP
jgi:ferric-dicitrate binding protein FerR (iron transport regulator)